MSKYFSASNKNDNWGDFSRISPDLLDELDKLREFLGVPVIVTSGFRASAGSQHSKGLAADIVVPAYQGRLLDLYLAAERFNFKGIGVYPDWTYKGQVVGGLHLDVREEKPARWMGIGASDGVKYIALTKENLKARGVI